MKKAYPEAPIVAVGTLVLDGNEVLMIRRGDEPDLGLWSIPGGLVMLGERVEDAAVREVEEETGVKVELKGLLGIVNKIVLDEEGRVKYHFVIIDFLGHPLSRDAKLSPEVTDARWVELEELKAMPMPDTLRNLLMEKGFIKEAKA